MNKLLGSKDFLLGTFSSNCSGGLSITKVPERWSASWDQNEKLALMLDEAGIDFMLPIARFIGYGGETDFQGSILETITWAAGLLAKTRNISIFSTVHTAVQNPVVLAKMMATMSQMSHGRAGLNIVAGWNRPEYEALGLNLPTDHKARYGYAQEWFDIVEKLWKEEKAFDWNGDFFKLKSVYGRPGTWGDERPPIFNAAGSGEGRQFAVRNADFLFTPAVDLDRSKTEVADLKAMAKAANRDVRMLTLAHIVCRPTEAEAKDYLNYYANEQADWGAVDELVRLQFENAQSFPHDLLALIRDRFAAGHGGFPLTGTPEQVADGICKLAETGFAGCTISFVDYVEEFPYFRDNVLPILEERGLRAPFKG